MNKNAKVKPIPEGFHTITPSLVVGDARSAIDFYERAFGAEEVHSMTMPGGTRIIHADLKIGDSHLFLSEELPEMGEGGRAGAGCGLQLNLYVRDVDQAFARAVDAGATVRQPLQDQFWGDRWGAVLDPFGYEWGIGSRKENLSHEEMERRGQEFFERLSGKQG